MSASSSSVTSRASAAVAEPERKVHKMTYEEQWKKMHEVAGAHIRGLYLDHAIVFLALQEHKGVYTFAVPNEPTKLLRTAKTYAFGDEPGLIYFSADIGGIQYIRPDTDASFVLTPDKVAKLKAEYSSGHTLRIQVASIDVLPADSDTRIGSIVINLLRRSGESVFEQVTVDLGMRGVRPRIEDHGDIMNLPSFAFMSSLVGWVQTRPTTACVLSLSGIVQAPTWSGTTAPMLSQWHNFHLACVPLWYYYEPLACVFHVTRSEASLLDKPSARQKRLKAYQSYMKADPLYDAGLRYSFVVSVFADIPGVEERARERSSDEINENVPGPLVYVVQAIGRRDDEGKQRVDFEQILDEYYTNSCELDSGSPLVGLLLHGLRVHPNFVRVAQRPAKTRSRRGRRAPAARV